MEVTLGLYYLVLHHVTLVTSVTFVIHVTSVTSVICSIRKFHQSMYISTIDSAAALRASIDDDDVMGNIMMLRQHSSGLTGNSNIIARKFYEIKMIRH
jgi:hypothetical protein